MICNIIQDNQDLNEFKIHMILQYPIPCKLKIINVINLICFLVKILLMNPQPMIRKIINN